MGFSHPIGLTLGHIGVVRRPCGCTLRSEAQEMVNRAYVTLWHEIEIDPGEGEST